VERTQHIATRLSTYPPRFIGKPSVIMRLGSSHISGAPAQVLRTMRGCLPSPPPDGFPRALHILNSSPTLAVDSIVANRTPPRRATGMISIRVDTSVDATAWNATVRATGGTIFHTAEWAAYTRAEQQNAVPHYYTLIDGDGSIAGVALGFRASSRRRLAAALNARRWIDALPVIRSGSTTTVSEFVGLIENHARAAGDVTFKIGSFASPSSEAVLAPMGFALARRLEFELDLSRDEKALWDAMDVKRRQRIKKAKKSGVEVRELEGLEGAKHLRRLQEASFERISARGGPSLDRAGDDQNDSILAFTNAGVGRVVGGFVDGACVSAGFFTTFNGLAYYAVSGHDARGLETQAPSLMLWETLLRLQREGFTRLNLGGCGVDAIVEGSPEHGVYSYKKAFGGTTLECATGEKVLRPRVRKMAELLRGVVR
jgi:hypothetical protein